MFIMMCVCHSTYIFKTPLNYLQFSGILFADIRMGILLGILSAFTCSQGTDPVTMGSWME